MNQYIAINHIQVQGANAVAGFTWGFPAITHFLGFVHNLTRKLKIKEDFSDLYLSGCAVIAHEQHIHTYGFNEFVQSRNPPYLKSHNKCNTPPVIEEGKMDMTVSLLIACEGNVGNRKEGFVKWLRKACTYQRLAGGSVLGIRDIDIVTIDDDDNKGNLRWLTRKLLPGFVLQDRSHYLKKYFGKLEGVNPEAEVFDAWLDFIAIKQKARPAFDKISQHLLKQSEAQPQAESCQQLLLIWQEHLGQPYDQRSIPAKLSEYFSENEIDEKITTQWVSYCEPDEKTDAIWEYLEKPESGFLVPIMVGYKAISKVYENHEVANTRDSETDICFVEAVHSIGEWKGVHRIRNELELKAMLWHYDATKEHWYLCKQGIACDELIKGKSNQAVPDDDF